MVEVPVRSNEQKSLTRATTDAEMQRITTRLEEAAAAAAAGEFGFTMEEAEVAEAASLAEREELAGIYIERGLTMAQLGISATMHARPVQERSSPPSCLRSGQLCHWACSSLPRIIASC